MSKSAFVFMSGCGVVWCVETEREEREKQEE